MADVCRIAVPTPSQDGCHLFRIPPELRNRIYEDLLYVPTDRQCVAIIHDRDTSGSPSVLRLLLTRRQIRDEAEGIFYNLNQLYFDVGTVDLPNFHRFLRALSHQRRTKIRRLNLDLGTVESLGGVLRILTRLPGLEDVTFGFPRGHDCLTAGLLMKKLRSDGRAIRASIGVMRNLRRIRVAVVGNEIRRRDPLVIDEARSMQTCLQNLVDGKNREATGEDDVVGRSHNSTSEPVTEAEWSSRRYSAFYDRFEYPEPYDPVDEF